MSKDLVRLLNLQAIATSDLHPSYEGTDESFRVIGQELDALASRVNVTCERRDELKRKAALQADELSFLRRALEEKEALCLNLNEEVSNLRAQLNRGLHPTEQSDTDKEQEEARDVEAPKDAIVDALGLSPERGFLPNLTIKNVPTEWKQEGTNWFAVFNPNVKRTLNITLINTFNHINPVRCVMLSPDMRYLSVACGTTVHVYNAKTGVEMCMFQTNSPLNIICFSPDSSILAVGSHDEQISVLSTTTCETRYAFSGHTTGIASLCISPDGRELAAGTYNSAARIWSLDGRWCRSISSSSGSILSIALLPNGLIALGCGNGSVEIWNKRKNPPQLVETIPGHESAVTGLAYIGGNRKGLLGAIGNRSLKYWDISPLLATRNVLAKLRQEAGDESLIQCTMQFSGNKESVSPLAVSHDNQWVVSGSKDHCVQFWDLETGTLWCMLKGHTGSIISIDLSQAGNVLVTGSMDGQVQMWAYT